MRLRDSYDIPAGIQQQPHSKAFGEFLWNWFGDSLGLTRGDVDLAFLNDLTTEERETAKDLLRRNLKSKHTHIIEGVAQLGDVTAAKELRAMLEGESSASRKLTIAGSLWRLNKDEAFVKCLREMIASNNPTLKQAHFHQILWLGDERAIEMLLDSLRDDDSFVRYVALARLNGLEFNRRFVVPANQMPHGPDYYESRRQDEDFRRFLMTHLRED